MTILRSGDSDDCVENIVLSLARLDKKLDEKDRKRYGTRDYIRDLCELLGYDVTKYLMIYDEALR